MDGDDAHLVHPPYAIHLRSDDRKIVRAIERHPWNRLRSIVADSQWVTNVALSLPRLPIVANLRCGAWYLSPDLPETLHANIYCYFKSTDGHANEWSFSLKRPNLDVASLIQQRGGIVITDSTRRGKSLPDALSKTIPIWCSVLTEASKRKYGSPQQVKASMIPNEPFRKVNWSQSSSLLTPAHQIPLSEHAQIEQKVDDWVTTLLQSDLPIPRLSRPLVPFFLTPPAPFAQSDLESNIFTALQSFELPVECHPVILLSASSRVDIPVPDPTGSFYYTQGSGDDEELWSLGLTPDLFWTPEHHGKLMHADRGSLPQAIEDVVKSSRVMPQRRGLPDLSSPTDNSSTADIALGTTGLYYGRRWTTHSFTEAEKVRYCLIIQCDAEQASRSDQLVDDQSNATEPGSSLVVRRCIAQGKKGLRSFQYELPSLLQTVQDTVYPANLAQHRKILIVDSTGKDLALSLLVAVLSLYYDSQTQTLIPALEDVHSRRESLTKDDVRRRLQWLVKYVSDANPSRSHLLRVNEVLLGRRSAKGVAK